VLGTGRVDIAESAFAGGSGVVVTTTVYATQAALDAEEAARIAGDLALTNYVDAATNSIVAGSGATLAQVTNVAEYVYGQNASNYQSGAEVTASIVAATNGLGAGGVSSVTAGTGLTNSGTAGDPVLLLNAASVASLALADSALQSYTESDPVWAAVSNGIPEGAALGATALQSYTESDPLSWALDGTSTPGGNLNFQSLYTITGLPTPANPSDVATKASSEAYADGTTNALNVVAHAGEADTLATVTGRGATTSEDVTFLGAGEVAFEGDALIKDLLRVEMYSGGYMDWEGFDTQFQLRLGDDNLDDGIQGLDDMLILTNAAGLSLSDAVLTNANLSSYAGDNITWDATDMQFDASAGGGAGLNVTGENNFGTALSVVSNISDSAYFTRSYHTNISGLTYHRYDAYTNGVFKDFHQMRLP